MLKQSNYRYELTLANQRSPGLCQPGHCLALALCFAMLSWNCCYIESRHTTRTTLRTPDARDLSGGSEQLGPNPLATALARRKASKDPGSLLPRPLPASPPRQAVMCTLHTLLSSVHATHFRRVRMFIPNLHHAVIRHEHTCPTGSFSG